MIGKDERSRQKNKEDFCMSMGELYLKVVQERFTRVKADGDQTIAQLNNEQLHWAFNEDANSIAVIVKHVSGNMISRWSDFLTTDGEKSTRNRDDEFNDSLATKSDYRNVGKRLASVSTGTTWLNRTRLITFSDD